MRFIQTMILFIFPLVAGATGLNSAISKVSSDPQCTIALALAEQVVIEKMPRYLPRDEIDRKLEMEHRLIGLWFSSDDSCVVYDIMTLKQDGDLRSPHEILEIEILEGMLRDGAISRYEADLYGAFYRLYK